MDEIKIKEAFWKIKEEMFSLGNELSEIRKEVQETNKLVRQMDEELVKLKLDFMLFDAEKPLKNVTGKQSDSPTDKLETTSNPATPTHNPTHGQEIGGWNTPNSNICIGNEGVPTDRQTNSQTVQQTHILPEIPNLVATNPPQITTNNFDVVTNKTNENRQEKSLDSSPKNTQELFKPIKQQIFEASEIFESLDNIKKEIRRKFKSITKQEMLVFSTIYTLEEQDPDPDYKKVASKLNLSESSIRDYVQRIIKKGIPIEKEKLNNKKIILRISPQLKKIATLDTIIKLRSL